MEDVSALGAVAAGKEVYRWDHLVPEEFVS
jgi:hypothetical protein